MGYYQTTIVNGTYTTLCCLFNAEDDKVIQDNTCTNVVPEDGLYYKHGIQYTFTGSHDIYSYIKCTDVFPTDLVGNYVGKIVLRGDVEGALGGFISIAILGLVFFSLWFLL